MTMVRPITMSEAWKALEAQCTEIRGLHLRDLFRREPDRGERLSVDAAGIYLDRSKNRVTDETLRLLLQLAEQAGLRVSKEQ